MAEENFERWIPTKEFVTNDSATVIDDGKNTYVIEPNENPKQVFGDKKAPMSCIPAPVLLEVGVGMLEGALKYGRHNYRETQIKYSTYYDASIRHMMQFWEGEDIDPDSGLSHVTKAIASLVVLRDAMMIGKAIDDRPPAHDKNWINDLNKKTQELKERLCDIKVDLTV